MGPQARVESEVLLVPHVGHGALVVTLGAPGEGVAAAGELFSADRQPAAPGRAPGKAQAQAFPVADLVGTVDHAADDVGAEIAVVRTYGEADAVPAAGESGDFDRRHQPGTRPGASDRHCRLAADVLLAVDGKGVLVDAVCGPAGAQPCRGRKSRVE